MGSGSVRWFLGAVTFFTLTAVGMANSGGVQALQDHFDEQLAQATRSIRKDHLAAVERYLLDNPTASDREAAFVKAVDLANEQEEPAKALDIASAYHKEFPQGKQRDQVVEQEFTAAVADISTLDRARAAIRWLETPGLGPMASAAKKLEMADAYVRYDRIDSAREMLREVLAIPDVKKDDEARQMLEQRKMALDEIGKPFKDFRARGLDGKPLSVASYRGRVVW